MENEEMEKAQEMLNDKLEGIEACAAEAPYQAIELRLTDDEGNVLIKGSMRVADMMKLEEIQGSSKGETMQMFYFALEDDLKKKKENEN